MDRKEAIGVIKKNWPHSGYTMLREALETLIPELKESEDEQHRKWILEYLYDGLRKSDEQFKNQFECAIAWLEKQGEQKDEKNTDFTIYYPLKNGKGKYESIPYSFYGTLTSFSENIDLINFLRNCFYSEEECEEWIKKQDEQKPTWNEEDEKMFKSIIECIDGTGLLDSDQIDWLKSIKTQNQGVQNKQHLWNVIIALWDLLDKIDTFSDLQIDDTNPDNPFRKIEQITQERHKFVKSDGYNLYTKGEKITDFQEQNTMKFNSTEESECEENDNSTACLENQGEQSHWKPTEEQMQTLHAQLNEAALIYPEDKRVLTTLYEDLQKL